MKIEERFYVISKDRLENICKDFFNKSLLDNYYCETFFIEYIHSQLDLNSFVGKFDYKININSNLEKDNAS